jgi:hypothetical protein
MNNVGIDIHKLYSVLVAVGERGGRLGEARRGKWGLIFTFDTAVSSINLAGHGEAVAS